jgi:MYXO-CTERM domain-containing protein
VRFSQQHLGLPVVGRGASAVVSADASRVRTRVRLTRDLPATAEPRIDAATAARIAQAYGGSFEPARARLAWLPSPHSTRLAWLFWTSPGTASVRLPAVAVDARTGERLLAFDARRFDRQASVYEFNPTVTPVPTSVTLEELSAGANVLQSERIAVKNCVDRQTTRDLQGFMLHACELDQLAVADQNGDFPYAFTSHTAAEDAHAEVAMFYHVSKAYDLLGGLGMPDLPSQPFFSVVNFRLARGFDTLDLTALADPSLPLEPFDNAFYAPDEPFLSAVYGVSGGSLWFGQGRLADFSYDGDVVYHEFSHAMVDVTAGLIPYWHLDEQGAVPAPGTMNEALADYFSGVLTGDPNLGEYVASSFGLSNIRSLDNPATCPLAMSGEVHADSSFFSGALWAARAALDSQMRTVFDAAIVAALLAAPSGDLGYEELAELMLSAVGDGPLGAAGTEQLASAFRARGLLPRCERALEWAGKPVSSSARELKNAFVAPGLNMVPIGSGSAYAPGLFQLHVRLEPNAASLEVSWTDVEVPIGVFGPAQGGDYAPELLVSFSEPIRFQYAGGVSSNAGDPLTPETSGLAPTVVVDVPDGAAEAWLMIVNRGDDDGFYRALSVEQRLAATAPPPGGTGGSGTGGTAAGAPASVGDEDEALSPSGGGCACRAPPAPRAPGALPLVVAAGLALARRRKSRS